LSGATASRSSTVFLRRNQCVTEIRPEHLLNFIESPAFERQWEDLGLDDETDLTELQLAIMSGPTRGPVAPGTGGLRKLRFAPSRWQMGKRGATRVCYVYFAQFAMIYLVCIYAKGEKESLSAVEKKSIKALIERIENALRARRKK
jgi:hypothetical protein